MKARKVILTSLISLATLAPCKAQRVAQFISETGVTGEINKELAYFGGIHVEFSGSKLCSDLYSGIIVNPQKQATFEVCSENDYKWAKNIGSWLRETFHLSKRESNLSSEIAPVKFYTSTGKLDVSVAPAYTLQNDFREKEMKQGLSTVLSTNYNIDSNNTLKFETSYSSEPTKNLFDTTFGKLKNNISCVFSYLMKF